MKKYMIAILVMAAAFNSNTGFAKTVKHHKNAMAAGCPVATTTHHYKHHYVKKTPPKMVEEAMVINENSPTTVVDIRKGIVYVNDMAVTTIKNPKYEDHNITISYNAPAPDVSAVTDNTYTGNKPDMPMLGLFTTNDCNGGAMVEDILPNGPAEKAGLYPGDVITKLNDNDINNSEQLVFAIYKSSPGDNVSITYMHDGRTETTQATLTDASKVANCVNPETGACGCRKGYVPMDDRW